MITGDCNGRQVLLIDADDTLWENNVYFERVIELVQVILARWGIDPHVFRDHLNETERRRIPMHGYGTVNFTHSLVRSFEDLAPPEVGRSLSMHIRELGMGILDHPMEILDGVPETLEYLRRRYPLHLITKGDPDEQGRKVEASGLMEYFRSVDILREKSPARYRELLELNCWDPSCTWMIGNSPRSDINPAVSVGMHAVYIPHAHTWILEHEPPVSDPRVLQLECFSDLRLHF